MNTSEPPPIDPSQLPRSKANWSRTIGIIALIFGSLGFLGALASPFTFLVAKHSMKTLESQGADPDRIADYVDRLGGLTVYSAIGLGILGVLLALGGFKLIKRRPVASILLHVWAALKIVLGSYLQYRNWSLVKLQLDIQNSATGISESAAQITEKITTVIVGVASVGGILWMLALPVFLLIWLSRRKIKAEIREW
ncbi:MAG: hypothetical protein P1U87_17110 [Verrucomicrobiales bacterium]|nr:hypothetical protein [Verrucomicrobiales bacterium]